MFLCSFSFYWMLHTFQLFGGIPLPLAVGFFIPYTVILNLKSPLFVLLFGLLLRNKHRKHMPALWFVAGILALFTDYLSPQIFPWYWGNLVGGNPFLVQIAELTGIYGLSFVMFAASYVFYKITRTALIPASSRGFGSGLKTFFLKKAPSKLVVRRMLPVPLVLILLLVLGGLRKLQIEARQKTLPTIRAAIIQPNSPLEQPGKRLVTAGVLQRLMLKTIPDLTQKAFRASGGRLDLVVLPESGVPFLSTADNRFTRLKRIYSPVFERMAQVLAYNFNVDVFLNEATGEIVHKPYIRGKAYNSSVLYRRDGKRGPHFHKRVILAFGEYVPGIQFLEDTGLAELVPGMVRGARFYPGDTSNLIPYNRSNSRKAHTPPSPLLTQLDLEKKTPREFEKDFPVDRTFQADGYFLPTICYELIIPEQIRSFFLEKRNGNPDYIVNITQDGWYGDTVEPYQHFELGRIRAVETRRAIIRSTNNGVSGFVDLAGNYVTPLVGPRMTKFNTTDFQVWDVPINRDSPTIYMRIGNLWMWLPLGIFLLLVFLRVYRQRERTQLR